MESDSKIDIWIYSDIFFFDQAVSAPTAVCIHPEDVEEESIILHWKLPQESEESYIQVKPNAGIGETKKFLLSNKEELKIDNLTPGMAYEIAVASVKNGTMSKLKTIQCTLSKTLFMVETTDYSTYISFTIAIY